MFESAEALRISYEACRRLTRGSRSNFAPAFWMLPAEQRRAMFALYAFLRFTDDLVDRPSPLVPPAEALTRWRNQIRLAFDGALSPKACSSSSSQAQKEDEVALSEPPAESAKTGDPSSTDCERLGRLILPALVSTVQRFRIPTNLLFEVIDGVEMDLGPCRFSTFAELEAYCDRVAGAVGLACLYIWGFTGPEAFEPARKCGLAMQLTNILRDLDSDLRQHRCYLPEEDLRTFGCSLNDLRSGRFTSATEALLRFETTRAEAFFRESDQLYPLISPAGRRMYAMINGIYRALLTKIARRPEQVFRGRVSIGIWRKLWIAVKSLRPIASSERFQL